MTAQLIRTKLKKLANKDKAKILQGFFKTGPGEYGEGDLFLGVVVPDIRRVAKEFQDTPLEEIKKILDKYFYPPPCNPKFKERYVNCFVCGTSFGRKVWDAQKDKAVKEILDKMEELV